MCLLSVFIGSLENLPLFSLAVVITLVLVLRYSKSALTSYLEIIRYNNIDQKMSKGML